MTTGRARSLWLIPAIAALTTTALVVLAFVLDTGGAGARDAALLVGVLGLYVFAPVTVVCVVVATVLQIRRSKRVR